MLLKRLLLEIFGKRFTIVATDPSGKEVKKMPALVSKNTKPGEREFRVTWFNDEMMPYKHYDIDAKEVDDLLTTNRLPVRVSDKIVNYMNTNAQVDLKMLRLEPSNVPF